MALYVLPLLLLHVGVVAVGRLDVFVDIGISFQSVLITVREMSKWYVEDLVECLIKHCLCVLSGVYCCRRSCNSHC